MNTSSMKLYHCLILLLFFAGNIACKQQTSKVQEETLKTKTLDEIVTDNLAKRSLDDTIFLKFVLGWPKRQTENHFDYLVATGKVEPKSTVSVSILQIKGYPYVLQIDSTQHCATVISNSYRKGKLHTITLFTRGCEASTLKKLLTSIYGQPVFIENKKESYSSEEIAYWIEGNKQVTLTDGILTTIEFTDLRLDREKAIEELERDNRQKSIGAQKAKATSDDFK